MLAPMSASRSAVRQSVSLPSHIVRRVHALARRRNTSASKVIVALIEDGLQAKEWEKKEFFTLADRLARTDDPKEQARIKEELARMTFGS